jgi:hypothetical protein
MQYPTFQTQGWPIGSGSVESVNKLVVEARLKGAGMHWSRPQVNPMLALRNIVCRTLLGIFMLTIFPIEHLEGDKSIKSRIITV